MKMQKVTLLIKWLDEQSKTQEVQAGFGGEDPVDTTEDETIFYWYENFEEILNNNALDFKVIEIDGTDINEFTK